MEVLFLNPMNIVQLENYRQRLFLLKQEVVQSLTEESPGVVELDQSRMGRLSRMDYICDEAISEARLSFDPTVTRCLQCADKISD